MSNVNDARRRRVNRIYRSLRERNRPLYRRCIETAAALMHEHRLDLPAGAAIEAALVELALGAADE